MTGYRHGGLVTLCVPFYRQPRMLAKQLETWAQYDEETLKAFCFIVIDDCSPEPALDVMTNAIEPIEKKGGRLHLLRIDRDVQWNRGMARNLGTLEAPTEWVLHVDTDHTLPPEMAQVLVGQVPKFKRDRWFRFSRYRIGAADETRKKDKADPKDSNIQIHPHIDSYLCTPEAYWAAGGYNEDFSGVLGGGSPFLKEMERVNGTPIVLNEWLHVYTRHAVPDSSEHTLPRDPAAFKRRKQEIMKARGTLRGHDPIRLPWHKVF